MYYHIQQNIYFCENILSVNILCDAINTVQIAACWRHARSLIATAALWSVGRDERKVANMNTKADQKLHPIFPIKLVYASPPNKSNSRHSSSNNTTMYTSTNNSNIDTNNKKKNNNMRKSPIKDKRKKIKTANKNYVSDLKRKNNSVSCWN